MNTDDILKTAHIHVENVMLRVHVKDSGAFNIGLMNELPKPDSVLFIGRSNDQEQTKQSLLVSVVGDYDVNEIADWIKKYEQ